MTNLIDTYIFCPQCSVKLSQKLIDKQKVKCCGNCGFIFWNNPKPVVSILLYRNNKVLMLQRAKDPFKDYWVLPGGFINHDETPEDAIKRETKEETDLDINVDGIVGVYKINDDPRGVHIDIIFEGKARGTPELSKEDTRLEYFSPDQLPQLIAYKHREAIHDSFSKKDYNWDTSGH